MLDISRSCLSDSPWRFLHYAFNSFRFLVSKQRPTIRPKFLRNPLVPLMPLNRNFPFSQNAPQFCITARNWGQRKYPSIPHVTSRHFPSALPSLDVTLSEINRDTQSSIMPIPRRKSASPAISRTITGRN